MYHRLTHDRFPRAFMGLTESMLLEAAQRRKLVVALSQKERIGNAESKQAEKIYTICDQEPEFDFKYPEQDLEVQKQVVSSHVSSLRLLLRLIWFTPNANEKGCENLKALVDFFKKYPGLRKFVGRVLEHSCNLAPAQ